MPRISHSHESYQSKPPRSKWGTVLARYDRTGALIAWQVRAYRNFCGAYNRGPALWEQACRPVIFVAWKMMRPRWWAGWRENTIQQSEEMPRVRACDEEERADRQGRPAVEMPGLPVELDDAAAAAQAGADAGGVPFLAAGAVIVDDSLSSRKSLLYLFVSRLPRGGKRPDWRARALPWGTGLRRGSGDRRPTGSPSLPRPSR